MAEIVSTQTTHIRGSTLLQNTNYGTATELIICGESSNLSRALLYFDVSTLSTPSAEYLGLYFTTLGTSVAGRTYKICRLTQASWTEAGATWLKYDGTNVWTLAGGDFTVTGAITFTIPSANNTWAYIDISSLVDDAINNRSNKLYILIQDSDEAEGGFSGAYAAFIASDDYADSSYRPRLLQVVSKSFTSDTISSITETFSVTKQSFDISVANNLTAYVMNKNKGWSKITNAPYTSMIYRPSLQELWATRRNAGQICKVNSGSTFDGSPINSILQTGYFDFGQFDEVQAMEAKMAWAIKRVRALHSEIKSAGNLTLTVYTENDSAGQSFTITPTTTDNIIYNMVRTALSRDIRGKFISFKIANQNGEDFFIGKLSLRIVPKGLG